MNNALLYDGLDHWARKNPDKAALVRDDGVAVSYAELARWSDGIAAHLGSIGVAPGDVVAVSGLSCFEWIASAFGVYKAGAILSPFNERFVAAEMAHLISVTTPSAAIADVDRAALLREASPSLTVLAMEDMELHRDGPPAGWTKPDISSDAIALIIFTSGSSGKPKGVMFSHARHLDNIYELQAIDRSCGPDMCYLLTVSMQSGPGSMFSYPMTMTFGGTMVFLRKFDPAAALRLIVDHRVTFLPTFPQLWEQIALLPDFADADLSALHTAHVGGARVPPHILSKWREKGVMLRQIYGQTEVGGYATIATDRECLGDKFSCGSGLIHTRIRIVGPDGEDCPPGVPGEVQIKGPGTMIGYWKNPEATAETIVDGWIHTGDLGLLDDDGDFVFVDRSKDMIITGGFNVSPLEIERVIGEIPEIVEVAVISVPDVKFGEAPAACIFAEIDVEEEAVFLRCKANLAGFKLPRYVIRTPEPLPRLSNGKLNKNVLREKYSDAADRFRKMG